MYKILALCFALFSMPLQAHNCDQLLITVFAESPHEGVEISRFNVQSQDYYASGDNVYICTGYKMYRTCLVIPKSAIDKSGWSYKNCTAWIVYDTDVIFRNGFEDSDDD